MSFLVYVHSNWLFIKSIAVVHSRKWTDVMIKEAETPGECKIHESEDCDRTNVKNNRRCIQLWGVEGGSMEEHTFSWLNKNALLPLQRVRHRHPYQACPHKHLKCVNVIAIDSKKGYLEYSSARHINQQWGRAHGAPVFFLKLCLD